MKYGSHRKCTDIHSRRYYCCPIGEQCLLADNVQAVMKRYGFVFLKKKEKRKEIVATFLPNEGFNYIRMVGFSDQTI